MSISRESGLGVFQEPPSYSTTRPVDFYCDAPTRLRRGENFGVICTLINREGTEDLEAFVVLKGSPDYKFVHVEEYGYVVSYAPRVSEGDHHHFLWVRPAESQDVRIPVAPTVEQGTIIVVVELHSQITTLTRELEVEIVPEGSTVYEHTSVLLDLKNRANVLRFMNIIVDETPIIPYEVYRRYISGSPVGRVTLCGDVMGPVFPNDEPVSFESMFKDAGQGRFGKGTEHHIFNLAANTWQLHYLRLTNQLTQKRELAKTVFQQMNIEYSALLRRFSAQGWWSNWDDSEPSVWLTAWVVQQLTHVSFQDWEDYIYIDPKVVSSAVLWLLNYQNSDGAFVETSYYRRASLHSHIHYSNSTSADIKNVALTAQVLIALEVTAFMLQGNSKQFSASARQKAVGYLERKLPFVTDPIMGDDYAIVLTARALSMAKSSVADVAFGHMMRVAREEGGMTYWSRTPIPTNRVRYEFNRPFLQPKEMTANDAIAVESTSHALITIYQVEGGGVTFIQEKIVEWLNSMRLGDGGFVSSVDTIVALQALVGYSYNSRIKDITNLHVNVDIPDSNLTDDVYINGEDIAQARVIELPNVWGHVTLFAQGTGQAVAQLNVKYGVDYEPFREIPNQNYFQLKITEFFGGRNKSETSVAPTSGMAMLVVDIPSGYVLEQHVANAIVRSRPVPEIRDVDALKPGKTIWYFDRIPNETRCFDHTVKRYFPVSNMTRTRQAVILEPMRPERFAVRTFNATSLYVLSICEVCGSYECPYCPYYSSAYYPKTDVITILIIIFFLLVVSQFPWSNHS